MVSVPYEITLLSNDIRVFNDSDEFQYLMKLHYSQTLMYGLKIGLKVSVPYEITLLSNLSAAVGLTITVSVPYEITLLSNSIKKSHYHLLVSVPYEITLLSNHVLSCVKTVVFQYLMKLHYSQTILSPLRGLNGFQYLMKLHYSQTRLALTINNTSFSTL